MKYKLLTVPALYILELLKFVKMNRTFFRSSEPDHHYYTRGKNQYQYPIHRLTAFEKGPYYMGLRFFNQIPDGLKNEKLSIFTKQLSIVLAESCIYKVEDFNTNLFKK